VLGIVALVSGGGDDAPAGLRVQREALPGGGEGITVYVDDPGANVIATTRGRPRVQLVCLDSRGEVVVRATHPWPFTDTDAGAFDPHVHQTMSPEDADRVARCRLKRDQWAPTGTAQRRVILLLAAATRHQPERPQAACEVAAVGRLAPADRRDEGHAAPAGAVDEVTPADAT
jgi:hypothetical protein